MSKKSISDIAKELDVSVTTVSFILNGKAKEKRISERLTKKVLEYIEEVGYRPNPLARGLRTGKTLTIGLMVENISNPFFSKIARRIEEEAHKNGYKILYCSTDNDPVKTKELISMFRERQIDGYIISPPIGIEKDIESLMKAGIPVVLFDRKLENINIDSVVTDNYNSTYNATKHLAENYKAIGLITLESNQSQMHDRLMGYQRATEDLNLNSSVKKIPYALTEVEIQQEITDYLKTNPSLDALVFATNYLGINGLKAIHTLDSQKINELGIVAFDNHDLFELHTPTITAISQPVNEIANTAIRLLLHKLKKSTPEYTEQITLAAELQVRNSSLKKKCR